jgi:hypothetical protein
LLDAPLVARNVSLFDLDRAETNATTMPLL